jgi:hypothetical protein
MLKELKEIVMEDILKLKFLDVSEMNGINKHWEFFKSGPPPQRGRER